jgi:hypothetical protein
MTYEEHIEHFLNWYINHKNYTNWQKLLDEYKLDNEDIVTIYAKETNIITFERVDYWTEEFQSENILL